MCSRIEFVALFCVFFLLIAHMEAFRLRAKAGNAKEQCETLCLSPGSKTSFDAASKTCKCFLSKEVDSSDIRLMRKNAKSQGLTLEIISTERSGTIKREIKPEEQPTDQVPQLNITDIVTDARELIPTTTDGGEEIVGQSSPLLFRKFHQQKVVAQRRSRPISHEQQKLLLQQIRDHLNKLGQISDPPTRQVEIAAIRNNLKLLSHSVVVIPPVPQMRSRASADRIRTIVQQAKYKLKHLHSPIVGAQLKNSTSEVSTVSSGENLVETDTSPLNKKLRRKRPRFEIITQDPSLIDD